ncbi:SRPBCC family protein [Ekhidna sp.]|uniref:SRPBCC family protein n=1 Tax=Ekhidna sp. TaxID=2608089 RepID=UPI003C7AB28E
MTSNSGHTIYHNLVIKSSLDHVFDAVSNPDHLINWWPLKCSGSPQKGKEYNFYFGEEYDWFGEVVSCETGKSFHIKMTHSDEDWEPTTFGFDLAQDEGQVSLSFWHAGWQQCNNHFKIASFCWAMLLNGLKKYVEEGHIIPFENRS